MGVRKLAATTSLALALAATSMAVTSAHASPSFHGSKPSFGKQSWMVAERDHDDKSLTDRAISTFDLFLAFIGFDEEPRRFQAGMIAAAEAGGAQSAGVEKSENECDRGKSADHAGVDDSAPGETDVAEASGSELMIFAF